MTRVLHYPQAALMPDVLRAALGCGVICVVLWPLPYDAWGFIVLAPIGVLFAGYGALTLLRAALRIQVSCDEIFVNPGAKGLPGAKRLQWAALSNITLDYYSTRRDREGGWMQLTLSDEHGVRLVVDSRLEGFSELVTKAVRVSSRNGIVLDAKTADNLQALNGAEAAAGALER